MKVEKVFKIKTGQSDSEWRTHMKWCTKFMHTILLR